MIIAVDFDGTIVEHKYPEIGRELPFAIETLKKLQQERHRLILWSVREGKLLQEAVDFCRERGLEFYAVNSNYAEETLESDHYSRKLKADLFIDDRNLGGLPEWGMIYRMIHDKWGYEDIYQSSGNKEETKKRSFWKTLNPQLHSRSATYKRNGLLIRKTAIKSSRPFQCAYYPLTP